MIWVIVESALLRSGTVKNRGQLLAAYMIVYYIGTVVGQMMLGVVPTALYSVIPWVTALIVIAMLPLMLTHIANQDSSQPRTASLANA